MIAELLDLLRKRAQEVMAHSGTSHYELEAYALGVHRASNDRVVLVDVTGFPIAAKEAEVRAFTQMIAELAHGATNCVAHVRVRRDHVEYETFRAQYGEYPAAA